MKYIFHTLIAVFLPTIVFCQDITGLWKGTLFNDSTKQSSPYEIYITKDNGKYSGYSHSWFLIDGKQYYGIKKIKVRVAKDGRIILQDAALLHNNYPTAPDKNVYQLNVLDLFNTGNEATLDGPFATNRTKEYKELTGHITLKKANSFSESELLAYLHKNGGDKNFTAVK